MSTLSCGILVIRKEIKAYRHFLSLQDVKWPSTKGKEHACKDTRSIIKQGEKIVPMKSHESTISNFISMKDPREERTEHNTKIV